VGGGGGWWGGGGWGWWFALACGKNGDGGGNRLAVRLVSG
jgi:hypothetical protein